MPTNVSSEIAVLREITSVVLRERNVRHLLDEVIDILDHQMNMLRGTVTLLEGDELRIEASAKRLNAEERVLGRYHIGEGITGLVAKTGKAQVVPDIRKDRRFLNRTRSRGVNEALSFVCVPLIYQNQVVGTLSVDRKSRKMRPLLKRMSHFWKSSRTSRPRPLPSVERNVPNARRFRRKTAHCAECSRIPRRILSATARKCGWSMSRFGKSPPAMPRF